MADGNLVDDDRVNQITQAAARGDHDMLSELLDGTPAGTVNRRNQFGRTAIQVMNGMSPATARILIERGAAVNAPCPSVGRAPLHDTAETGCQATFDQLLRAGANPVARDKWGNTPAHLAAGNGGASRIQILEKLGRVCLLTERNDAGESPLDVATQRGHHEIIDWLHDFFRQTHSLMFLARRVIRHRISAIRVSEISTIPVHLLQYLRDVDLPGPV